jgi:hypothetical protein
MRLTLALAVLLAAAVGAPLALATVRSAPVFPGHLLLVDRPGLRVYGPADSTRTPCPQLLPLPARALSSVKRAIELAMPPFERKVGLDGRDAVVTVGPATRSGFSPAAAGCGSSARARSDWSRSVFANVYLPHVNGASLSQHRFAVGLARQGWVIWGYIH